MMKTQKKPGASVQSEDEIQLALNRKANQKERITLMLPFAGVDHGPIFGHGKPPLAD